MKVSKSVYIIPIAVILACSLFYFAFMAAFSNYGLSNQRFISVLNSYPGIESGSDIFIGDSQVREDIDCNILECYNIGVDGIVPLQLALQGEMISAAEPGTVFIGISPMLFREGFNVNDDFYLFLNGKVAQGSVDAVRPMLDEHELKLMGMNTFERQLYKRKFIIPHYLGIFRSSGQLRVEPDNFKDPWQYEMHQTDEQLRQKISSGIVESFKEDSTRQYESFAYLLDSLTTSGTDVVVVQMPLHPYLIQALDSASYDAFIGLLEKNPDIALLDYTEAYAKENFIDLTHLDATGRKDMSNALKEDSDALQ